MHAFFLLVVLLMQMIQPWGRMEWYWSGNTSSTDSSESLQDSKFSTSNGLISFKVQESDSFVELIDDTSDDSDDGDQDTDNHPVLFSIDFTPDLPSHSHSLPYLSQRESLFSNNSLQELQTRFQI